MRHRKAGRTLGRTADQRQAMTRSQMSALLRYGRLTTTEAKAKELRRWVERLITDAKPNDVNAHRRVAARLGDTQAVKRLFSVYVQRFGSRNGGYTRVIHMGNRTGDNASIATIEFVEEETQVAT